MATQTQAPPVTLATPLTLPCGMTMPNRIAKAPMSEQLSDRANGPTEALANVYRRWAEGGLGLFISGNLMIDSRSLSEPRNVVIEDDRHIEALAACATAAKSGGAPAIAQINHPGRQALSGASAQTVAPSPIRVNIPGTPFAKPRELTHDEILELIERFATTAQICVEAGFDGVQLHAAHGYLVSQFLSPLSNQRTDEWGGDAERRRRFILEITREMRSAIGADKILSVKLNSADFQRGGFSEDESLIVIDELGEQGVDLLEISGGTYERPVMVTSAQRRAEAKKADSTKAREAYFLEFAERARAVTKMPLMVTGGLRSSRAMQDALDEGVDVIGLGRPLCLEPDLPQRLIDDSSTVSKLKDIRTGVKLFDAPADLWWNNIQIHRLAAGKQPRARLTGWEALGHTVLRDGFNTLRRKRG